MRVLAIGLLLAGAPVLAQVPAEAPVVAPAVAPQPPQPLAWTEAAARVTLAAVKASAAEGLSPGDYGLARLEAALAGADAAEVGAAAQASWMALGRAYAAGHTPMEARRGWKGPVPRHDPEWLRAKLADGLLEGGPGAALQALLPTHPHYGLLKAALAKAPPAERALIRANLDRWRWLPRMLGERYLMANLPAYEVDLWDGGRPIARHRIIIGKPNLATPQFSASATGVTMNPPWLLPQSIVEESVGGLIRRSPAAHDRRVKTLQLSREGTALLQRAEPAVRRVQERLLAPLPATEREMLMRLLRELVALHAGETQGQAQAQALAQALAG